MSTVSGRSNVPSAGGATSQVPSLEGRYGRFGGRYVPETLTRALDELTSALELDPNLRSLIPDEPDFDALRGNPEFERLAFGPAPLA